jgi:hypothetical protein
VAVTREGQSIFDPQRYISDKVSLSEEASLVIANHPVHRWMASILHETSQIDSADKRWSKPLQWLADLTRKYFNGQIIFLTPTTRKAGTAVSLALGINQMEGWKDLTGAQCKSYRFKPETINTSTFSMDVKDWGKNDGLTRMSTDFKVKLTSEEGNQIRFHLTSSPESIHWEDVLLYGEYDKQFATYIALLTELLNSEHLRRHWAKYGQQIWGKVPNDRELLRLLLLQSRLDSVFAQGNVFQSQLLPNLIHAETILASHATTSESLSQDHLFFWAATTFIELTKNLDHRFAQLVRPLRASVEKASSALKPTFVEVNQNDGMLMKQMSSQFLPLILWRSESVQKYLEQFSFQTSPDQTSDPEPLNPRLARLRNTEWSHIKVEIPAMKLKKTTLVTGNSEKSAAAHAKPPTLETAWKEAEKAWWKEYIRRALQKSLGDRDDVAANMAAALDVTTLLDVTESLLSQQDLIEEHLTLREQLFSDSQVYLEQSDTLHFLRDSTLAYSTIPESGNLDEDNVVTAIKTFSNLLIKVSQLKSVRSFFDEDHLDSEIEGIAAEALQLLQEQPRMRRILSALWTAIDSRKNGGDKNCYGHLLVSLAALFPNPEASKLAADFLNHETDTKEILPQLEKLMGHLPLSTQEKAFVSSLPSRIKLMVSLAKEEDIDQDKFAELAADILIWFRDLCYKSPHLGEISNTIDKSVFTDEFTIIDIFAPDDEDGNANPFYERVKTVARKQISTQKSLEIQSPTEQRFWRFMNRMAWFANLPKGQRPVAIVRNYALGRTSFEPPCPQLEEWIREVATASERNDTDGAYPFVAEALVLDLALRTLRDETPNTYHTTEFGAPRRIFETLCGQTVEKYLSDCLQSEREKSVMSNMERALDKN